MKRLKFNGLLRPRHTRGLSAGVGHVAIVVLNMVHESRKCLSGL